MNDNDIFDKIFLAILSILGICAVILTIVITVAAVQALITGRIII